MAIQGVVGRAVAVLEVFPAGAAVLVGGGRDRAEVAARVVAVQEADERVVTVQEMLLPAVALREVFLMAPVMQEVVARAKIVREAVARAMTVREVIVRVLVVREVLLRRDWARFVSSSCGRAGGIRERRPSSVRSTCAPPKPVHSAFATDPSRTRSSCSCGKTSHLWDAEGR